MKNTDNLQERLFGNDNYTVQELPQTGNNQKTGLILSFAGLLMIIGAIVFRKKKH